MKKKQIVKIIILSILIVLAALALVFIVPKTRNNNDTDSEQPQVVVDEPEVKKDDKWLEYYEINNDYVGHIYFESNIINLPFVQGETNETYYRTDWQTLAHDEEGSIFMDSRNDILVDQNIIIYGHNVYASYEPSLTHKFTPLHKLTDVNGYEDNKIFYLDLKDRIEKYEVAIVYRCKIDVIDNEQYINPDEPAFYYTNYTEEEFNNYIALAKAREYYDTGVNIDYSDKMVTLQTCYEGSPDKLIVSAKLINTEFK